MSFYDPPRGGWKHGERGIMVPYAEDFNATTSIVKLPASPLWDSNQPFTVFVYARYDGLPENNLGYLVSHDNTAGITLWMNTSGYPTITTAFKLCSTGNAELPQVNDSTGVTRLNVTPGDWFHLAAVSRGRGSVLASDLSMIGAKEGDPLRVLSGFESNGSGSLVSTDGKNFCIGNRYSDTARTWNGLIVYVARWNKVLTSFELERIRRDGPLSHPDGLVLCWSGGRDWSASSLRPESTTAIEFGGGAPNQYLRKPKPTVYLGPERPVLANRNWLAGKRQVVVPYAEQYNNSNSSVVLPATSLSAPTPSTFAVYFRRDGSHANNYGYLFGYTSTQGPVMWHYDTSNTFTWTWRAAGAAPQVYSSYGSAVGEWWHAFGTKNDTTTSASAGSMELYLGKDGTPVSNQVGFRGSGSGSLTDPSTLPLYLGNRSDSSRTFNGLIAYNARWNRVLDIHEMWKVQTEGPLAVPDGLIYCWSGGRDWSVNGFKPQSTTAIEFGGGPPTPYLRKLTPTVFIPQTPLGSVSIAGVNDITASGATPRVALTI